MTWKCKIRFCPATPFTVTPADAQEHDGQLGPFSVDTYDRRLFPTELELIQMISVEYVLKKTDSCIHECTTRDKKVELISGQELYYLNDCVKSLQTSSWNLLEVFEQEKKHGAAFFNTKSNQLVIVHRGTDNLRALWADLTEIRNQVVGSFGATAFHFTKRVVEKYGAAADSITVTGHSLGGWLSQLSTFFIKYPNYAKRLDSLDPKLMEKCQLKPGNVKQYGIISSVKLSGRDTSREAHHLHCVCFDSPGCKELIEKYLPKSPEPARYTDDRRWPAPDRILDSLDVTVYLTAFDFANIVNEQVGGVYQMKCDSLFPVKVDPNSTETVKVVAQGGEGWVEWGSRIVGSHSSVKILAFWRRYWENDNAVEILKVTDWLTSYKDSEYVRSLWRGCRHPAFGPRSPYEFRMSCLNEHERNKIRTLIEYRAHCAGHGHWDRFLMNHNCIKYLTKGFSTEHDLQVMKVQVQETEVAHGDKVPEPSEFWFRVYSDIYRDFFIRRLKAAVVAFDKSNISDRFPNFVESVYVNQTFEYVHSLPKFNNCQDPEPFEWLNVVSHKTQAALFEVPPRESHICTGKLYQVMRLRSEWFQDPVQYFVVDTTKLGTMDHLLAVAEHESGENTFLPRCKFCVIELRANCDLSLLGSWITKLSRESVRKIVIVHDKNAPIGRLTDTMDLISVDYFSRGISHTLVASLYDQVDLDSLVQAFPIQFKLQGSTIRLSDLIPKTSSMHNFFSRVSSEKLVPSLYSVLMSGVLGRFLPTLAPFEESYFLKRRFGERIVTGYSTNELIVIIRDSGVATKDSSNEFVKEFARLEYESIRFNEVDEVLCTDDMAYFNSRQHKIVVIENLDGLVIQLESQGLSGHVVRQQIDFAGDGSHQQCRMIWQKVFGNPDMIKLKIDCDDAPEYTHDCISLVSERHSERVVLLVDEPGMGKTTIMQKLAIFAQTYPLPDGSIPWTIFVPLRKFCIVLYDSLPRLAHAAEISLSQVVTVLAKIEGAEYFEIYVPLLETLLQEDDRVCIFFDGLDEINENFKVQVLKIAQTLQSTTKARVFIASRKRLTRELKVAFRVPPYKLIPFKQEESADFLAKFWSHNESKFMKTFQNVETLTNYTTLFLQKFRNAVGEEADKFIGIPFQLRMIADSYFSHFCEFHRFQENLFGEGNVSTEQMLKFMPKFSTSLTELYQNFIETKISVAVKDKLSIDVKTGDPLTIDTPKLMYRLHATIAFDHIFSSQDRVAVCDRPDVSCLFPESHQIDALHKMGLINEYVKNQSPSLMGSDATEFVHRTIAEYLSAQFIFENLILQQNSGVRQKSMKHFLDSFIFIERYERVLSFLNLLILNRESTPEIFKKVVDLKSDAYLGEITSYFNAGRRDVDLLDRTLLHYLFMHSFSLVSTQKCSSCGWLKWNHFLMSAEYLMSSRDFFDSTPMGYLHACWRENIFHTYAKECALFSILMSEEHVDIQFAESAKPLALSDILSQDGVKHASEAGRVYCECKCPFDTERVLEFCEKNKQYLFDLAIELRKNTSSPALWCDMSMFPIDLNFALTLKGDCRIEFICTLQPSSVMDDLLFNYFQADRFKKYSALISHFDETQDSELRLLTIFEQKIKSDILFGPKRKRALYDIWWSTQFESLRPEYIFLSGRDRLRYWFRLISVVSELLPSIIVTRLTSLPHWLQNPPGGDNAENVFEKMARVLPLLYRILDEKALEHYVYYSSDFLTSVLSSVWFNEEDRCEEWDGSLQRLQTLLSIISKTKTGSKLVTNLRTTSRRVQEWLNAQSSTQEQACRLT